MDSSIGMEPPEASAPDMTAEDMPAPVQQRGTATIDLPKAQGFGKASDIKRGSALVLFAPEGWGKTSFGAFAPKTAFIEGRDESGLAKLVEFGRIPDVPTIKAKTWPRFIAELDSIGTSETPPPFQMLCLDSVSAFETMARDFICQRDFNGQWTGKEGFQSYYKGFFRTADEWILMLTRLEAIQEKHGTTMLMLAHSKVKTLSNPSGDDFDRHVIDCDDRIWGPTAKWADAVFFGNWLTILSDSGKGIGGTVRKLYTTHTDNCDAKNRFGLPSVIEIPNDESKGFETLVQTLKGLKK